MQLPPLGLYIHLPWCERKCPYCDFNSHEAQQLPEVAYVDALLADLEGDLHLADERAVQTLFIGGGTPSLFRAETIGRLIAGIRARLELAAELEITLEANPGSAEAEKFQDFRAQGVNRLSLGIQSLNDSSLQALGRIHDGTRARAAIDMARRAGFESLNLDLMHGLPGQTTAMALTDLKAALACEPTHLSWYQLTVEPNTVFHKRPPVLPTENSLEAMQDKGERLLADAGYRQYEVSAYSRPGFECRHNLNYWSFGDYLAIGAGAHGKITDRRGHIVRYHKTRRPEDYLAAGAGAFTAGTRTLAREDLIGEFMLNALRLNRGFSTGLFEHRTGLDVRTLQPQLQPLCDRGLLEQDIDGIRATPLGRRFLDSVIAEFFA